MTRKLPNEICSMINEEDDTYLKRKNSSNKLLSDATFGNMPLRKSSDLVERKDLLEIGNSDLKKLEFLSISSDRKGAFRVQKNEA